MALSTNLISGLSSGFDWRSMIDKLMEIEHRRVDLIETQKTDYESNLEIYQSINTKLLSFKTQAETLAKSSAFNVFTTSLFTNSSTYSASSLISVSTGADAAPGTHTITMNASSTVAQARKISSKSFASYDTALNIEGEFVINRRSVSIEPGDDLYDVRDKINNLNSGANATGVTASVLTVSTGNYRLVLTSDDTGEDAFTIFDAGLDAENILSDGLGFMDGTTSVKNMISNGAQSEAFSSSSQSVGSMLGLNSPQSGANVLMGTGVNQFTVNIDLSKNLTQIATDINTAALGTNISASVVSTTEDGVKTYRLKIENTTQFIDDNHVLETLGILEGDQESVQEVHQGSKALYDGSDALLDTDNGNLDTINLTSLRIAVGTSAGVNASDTIRVMGAKGDGTSVDAAFTVGVTGTTVQDLVDWVDTQFSGGGNNVTVRFDDGKIKITDDDPGDSRLSVLIASGNEGGGQLDFGTVSATTEGYTMQVQQGQDAHVVIDGTAVTSSSNEIDDVISGVTMNLLTVESGATVTLTVSRDYDSVNSSVQELLDAYNDVLMAINEQTGFDEKTQEAGPLQGDSTIGSIKSSLQNMVVNSITGLPATANALSLIGITSQIDYSDHTNDGKLVMDDDTFTEALKDDFHSLRRIFVAEGTTTDGDVEYVTHAHETVAGNYAINITQAATQASVTGSTDLSGGLGAAETLTITDTATGREAQIQFSGGESLTQIVNAINSELSQEYTQKLVGDTANMASGSVVTYLTQWSQIDGAGVSADDTIGIEGTKKGGESVSGTYTIDDTGDSIQGFLSYIESIYDNEVSAYLDSSGKLVIEDNVPGDSQLSILLTENNEGGGSLSFGTVLTTNADGVEGRDAVNITASVSGNTLKITHGEYGSSNGFTLSQNVSGAEYNEIVTTATSNTTSTSDGKAYVIGTTKWNEIYGVTAVETDTITISGTDHGGNPVFQSYDLYSGVAYKDMDSLLMAIETAFGNVDARMEQGRIVVEDLEGCDGSLAVNLQYNGSGGLTLGDGSNDFEIAKTRDLDLGLVNGAHTGMDVQGTINSESATGSGQILVGDAPGTGETTSIEGLTIRYTGTGTGSQGYIQITLGVAELFNRVLYDITNAANGYLDYRMESMTNRINDLEVDIKDQEARLERKMETMIARFVAMELALSELQSQSNWLSGQLTALFQK